MMHAGDATSMLPEFGPLTKEYSGVIRLGRSTDTHAATGVLGSAATIPREWGRDKDNVQPLLLSWGWAANAVKVAWLEAPCGRLPYLEMSTFFLLYFIYQHLVCCGTSHPHEHAA
jgi:hypothetical protein